MNVMIYVVMIIVAFAIGLMSARNAETPKARKKSGIIDFFCRLGEGDVTYPGYTVHKKKSSDIGSSSDD
jgi:hypothetical protein